MPIPRFHTRAPALPRLLMAALIACRPPLPDVPPAPSLFPVGLTVPRAPQPVMADGRLRLLYELHVTNYNPSCESSGTSRNTLSSGMESDEAVLP
jgi:hypothetical protein